MDISDFFKKFFNKKQTSNQNKEYKYCINCTHKISTQSKVCEKCQYDQDRPIIKNKTELNAMINGVFIEFYDKKLYTKTRKVWDKFIKQFSSNYINDIKYNKIINELTFLVLSLKYNMFTYHYAKHPKIDIIDYTIANRIFDLLIYIFGNNREDMKNLFIERSRQYLQALKDENPMESAATLFQFIIEAILNDYKIPDKSLSLEIAKTWAFPSHYHSILCFDFVVEIIIPFKIILNKWEIQL